MDLAMRSIKYRKRPGFAEFAWDGSTPCRAEKTKCCGF